MMNFAYIEFNSLVHNETTDQNDDGDNRDNFVRVCTSTAHNPEIVLPVSG